VVTICIAEELCREDVIYAEGAVEALTYVSLKKKIRNNG
jgi:hypothetical protein